MKIAKEPVSLEAPVGDEEDSSLGDFIADENALQPVDSAIHTNLKETCTSILSSLTPREERVLRMRFGIGMSTDHTLEEVGQQFNVTRERIRQIEAKALRINTQALGKHSNNLTQVEAILFGQAGLLDEENIPCYYRQFAIGNDYFNELKREYCFLSNKFGLASIDYRKWGAGNATPHLRIARIASLYYHKRLTISGITESYTLTELYRLLNTPLEGYWQNHTCFGGTETCGNGAMRQKQVDVIIINSVVPLLYIYGRHRREEALCSRAEELLHQIESEENSIIKRWRGQGVVVDCAADSQALLQLNRRYCRINNCTECHFGYHYIKERLDKHF